MENIQPLSTFGNSHYIHRMLNTIMLWYIYSNYSQTIFHRGNVKSLKHTIYENFPDETDIKIGIRDDLLYLYGNYFEDYDIEIDVDTINNDSKIYINIEVKVSKDNIYEKLNKTVSYEDRVIHDDLLLNLYYKNLKQ